MSTVHDHLVILGAVHCTLSHTEGSPLYIESHWGEVHCTLSHIGGTHCTLSRTEGIPLYTESHWGKSTVHWVTCYQWDWNYQNCTKPNCGQCTVTAIYVSRGPKESSWPNFVFVWLCKSCHDQAQCKRTKIASCFKNIQCDFVYIYIILLCFTISVLDMLRLIFLMFCSHPLTLNIPRIPKTNQHYNRTSLHELFIWYI